jgi:hypothetical protein
MLWRFSALAMLYGLAAGALAGTVITVLGTLAIVLPASAELAGSTDLGALVTNNPELVGVALLGALAAAFTAGNAAASLAPGDELPNALATGCVLLVTQVLIPLQLHLGVYPAWYTLPVIVLTVPLCALGGLHRRGPATA